MSLLTVASKDSMNDVRFLFSACKHESGCEMRILSTVSLRARHRIVMLSFAEVLTLDDLPEATLAFFQAHDTAVVNLLI